jgi:hypothetical protein
MWRDQIVDLPPDHDPGNWLQAMAQAHRDDAIPLGVFYKSIRPTLNSHTRVTNHPLKADGRRFDVRSQLETYR